MPHRHGFEDYGGGGGGGGPIALSGDVTGMSNANVVQGFATYSIDTLAPATGDTWVFDGTDWQHLPQAVSFLVPYTPSTSIVSNRSADQSATTAGKQWATNLGNDTTGAATGIDADYATLVGGDGNSATDDYSTAIGGYDLTAGGFASVTLGGFTNAVDFGAEQAFVVGGSTNTALNGALNSGVVGGTGNSVSGSRSVVVGGQQASVSSTHNAALGGLRVQLSHTHGIGHGIAPASRNNTAHVHAGGQTEAGTAHGNRQWSRTVARQDTAGAAPNETANLGYGGYNVPASVTTFAMLDDRCYLVRAHATAVRTAGAPGEGRSIVVHGFVRRTGGAVNVVAQHLVSHIGDPGCCQYDLDLIASGGNLLVQGSTGASNTHATRWVATVEWEEVKYT